VFGKIEREAGTNRFIMSVGQWIERTDAIKENLIPQEITKQQTVNKPIAAMRG